MPFQYLQVKSTGSFKEQIQTSLNFSSFLILSQTHNQNYANKQVLSFAFRRAQDDNVYRKQ